MKIPFIISVATFASCLFSYGDAYQMSDAEKKYIKYIEVAISKEGQNHHKALTYAAGLGYANAVKKLLDAGVDINASDNTKTTALHNAASRGRLEVVKVLIQAGAAINAETNRGFSPLHLAAENGHIEIVKALIQAGADVNHIQEAHKLASKSGHTEIAKILSSYNQEPQTNVHEIQLQQISDAEKNYIDTTLRNFISSAGFNPKNTMATKFLEATAAKGYAHAVKTLLDAGVNANVCTRTTTALHEAAYHGRLEVVQVLIQAGADVNSFNSRNYTPLHNAAQGGHIEVVKELIQAGAGTNYLASGKGGESPRHLAKEKGHDEIVQFLAPYTIDLCDPLALVNSIGKGNWRDMDAILQAKSKRAKNFPENINIDVTNKYGTSALHVAAKNGHAETVDFFIQNKANVNILDYLNMTPLHSAASMGHSDIISSLLEAGANINAVSTTGNTALITAAARGHLEAVKSLLQAGAELNIANMFGYTALHQAKRKGHTEIVNILTEAGAK